MHFVHTHTYIGLHPDILNISCVFRLTISYLCANVVRGVEHGDDVHECVRITEIVKEHLSDEMGKPDGFYPKTPNHTRS